MTEIAQHKTVLEFRTAMNLSRREVAELAGLPQSRIWKLEKIELTADADEKLVADHTKYWDALENFETENPGGKPKPAKGAGNDAELEALRGNALNAQVAIMQLESKISEKIEANKAAKKGSSELVEIKAALDEILAQLGYQSDE